jgi:hypothetical protein
MLDAMKTLLHGLMRRLGCKTFHVQTTHTVHANLMIGDFVEAALASEGGNITCL